MNSSEIFFKNLTVSIVSHGQGFLVKNILSDLEPILEMGGRIILTINIPESEDFLTEFKEKITVIRNKKQKGFGENHNTAFLECKSEWFSVINPDLRCNHEIFKDLILEHTKFNAGVSAPKILNSQGKTEDSARIYPTLKIILQRVLFRLIKKELTPDYNLDEKNTLQVDWIAGMLLLFKSIDFEKIGGFDQKYFMYLEDADICLRLKKNSRPAIIVTKINAIHDAQRASNNNYQHLKWHISSLLKFFKEKSKQ